MESKPGLLDTTFVLLVRLDSMERLENVLCVTRFLLREFDTHVLLWECAAYPNGILRKLLPRSKNLRYEFHEDRDPVLHRTRWLNCMYREARTPWVAAWDVDVIAEPRQITASVQALRDGVCEFVYPYRKYFLETSPILRELFLKRGDLRTLSRNRQKMKRLYFPDPVGGAFLFCKTTYEAIGYENEEFYNWGMEDGERYMRWKKLGYRVKRIDAPLYHLTHPRGLNSTDIHLPKEEDLYRMKQLKDSYYLISNSTERKYERGNPTKNL